MLEILSRNPMDILILDVTTSELDGYGVCRVLRNVWKSSPLYPRSGILNLFVSALGQEGDELLGYQLGADDFSKPFSLAVLYAKVLAMLKRTQYRYNERCA